MKLKILIQELFYFLSVSLAIFFLMELVWPRVVLAYFNLNYLLLAWLIIGIILIVFFRKK